jgi:hypothetical protein
MHKKKTMNVIQDMDTQSNSKSGKKKTEATEMERRLS